MRSLCLAVIACVAACGGGSDDFVEVDGVPDTAFSLNDVWSFGPNDVWVAASSGILHFDGEIWTEEELPVTTSTTGLFGFTPDDLWACGGTSILHYDGASWTLVDDTAQHGLDGLTSIWASSADDVWVVGDDGIAVNWNGATSTRTLTGATFASHVFGFSPTDIYVLGTFDLVHYDGSEWTAVDTGLFGGDGEVWGTAADDIWVLPDDDTAAHFDGSTWELVEIDTIGDLSALWGLASDDIWAAGSPGSVAHYNGERWTEVQHQKIGSPQLRLFFGVHASGPDDIWAVGQVLNDAGARGIAHRFEP